MIPTPRFHSARLRLPLVAMFAASIITMTSLTQTAAFADDSLQATVASGLTFPEGPALSPDGQYLYCVNVQGPDISRVDLKTGELKKDWVVLPTPGRGNGATIGPDGNLYVADVGRKCIDRIDIKTGVVSTYIDKSDTGGPLLGPNDLCFDRRGNLYFTDPDGSSVNRPIGAAYMVVADVKTVNKIGGGLAYPNGIVVTPDGDKIYVNESPKSDITEYEPLEYIAAPTNGLQAFSSRLFTHIDGAGGPDGMRMDKFGYIYAAMYGGGRIVKINPKGSAEKVYPIDAGPNTTNLCFSKDGKSLYVTETKSNSIVKIKL